MEKVKVARIVKQGWYDCLVRLDSMKENCLVYTVDKEFIGKTECLPDIKEKFAHHKSTQFLKYQCYVDFESKIFLIKKLEDK